jgi:hypothetical protein
VNAEGPAGQAESEVFAWKMFRNVLKVYVIIFQFLFS